MRALTGGDVGQVLLEGEALESLIVQWCDALAHCVGEDVLIIGIRTGGDVLAERALLHLRGTGRRADLGLLDIALYRDDHGLRTGVPRVLGTDIPHKLDDREVLLIDDVFYTGRTIRAALSRLSDLGRPKTIRLAALARRPGHQVPIVPDVIGYEVPDPGPKQRVQLDLSAQTLSLEEGNR